MKAPIRMAGSALLPGALASLPGGAAAQSSNEPWQFGAAVYGWFPTIAGNTSFPSGPGGGDITFSARQVLDSLEFGVMGALEARKGHWGIVTDLLYKTPVPASRTRASCRSAASRCRPTPHRGCGWTCAA